MAQDPDREDENQNEDGLLTTHALDVVTLFQSSTIDGQMEADMIRGILDANGIPAILSGPPYSGVPDAEVKVPRGRLMEAQKLIAEAQAAGPEAAAEAEAASEEK
jgi:Putative prokaryotic signal transducing protein